MMRPVRPRAKWNLSLVLMLLAIPGLLLSGGCGKDPPPSAPGSGKATPGPRTKTPGPGPSRRAPGKAYRYSSAEACSGCHAKQFAEWQGTLHAMAHFEPIYDHYFMLASRDSNKKLETYCGKCHTPLGVRAGELPFKHVLKKSGDTKVSKVAAEGLNCDFCHTLSGRTGIGNSSYKMRPSDTKLAALTDARPTTHRAEFAAFYRSSEYCGTCHQVSHPTNGIVLEDTYAEWKASPYASAGITCQNCHMAPGLQPPTAVNAKGIGKSQKVPGRAATMGRKRPHISDHTFLGPNVVFLQGKKWARRRALSIALLRQAGRVAVRSAKKVGSRLELVLAVSNVGAGHHLPTGVTEIRQLWLEILVRDGAGKVLLHSGKLDAAGNLGPKAIQYRTVVHDDKGRDTSLFWRTVKKVSDRRIPALGTLTENVKVALGKASKGTIEVHLRYRSVSPAGLAEAGVPKGTVKVPVLTVASAKRNFP